MSIVHHYNEKERNSTPSNIFIQSMLNSPSIFEKLNSIHTAFPGDVLGMKRFTFSLQWDLIVALSIKI